MTREEAIKLLICEKACVEDVDGNIGGERVRQAYDMAIEALTNVQNMHKADWWIPCAKRLPEAEYGESDCVMATCCWVLDTKKRWIEKLYYDGGNWCYPTSECFTNKVLAWMPLPKPYREDGEA